MVTPKFSLHYHSGGFRLNGVNTMPPLRRQYLTAYLEKFKRRPVLGFFRGDPVYSLYQAPLSAPSGIRSLEMRLKRRFDNARIPATATLGINKACQCQCEHCSAVFYNSSQKTELTTMEWRQAIEETVDLGVTQIIFVGGEPLLRRDLPTLVASIPANQAIATLFTNGEFLDQKNCATLAEAGLMGVFVSLDSPDGQQHDQLRRRKGLFAMALGGLECAKNNGLLTAISTYLSPERLELGIFEATMELGKKIGVHEVTFFDAIPSGRWLNQHSCLLRPPHREKIRLLVKRYRQIGGFPSISAQSLLTSEFGSACCFAANTQFYLTAHGEMCPCDFTPLTIGRFPEQSIHTLWNQMISIPPYRHRAKSCRMQDPEFHRQWLSKEGQNIEWPRQLIEIKS